MTRNPTSHSNNFGLLRLLFAMCVLISHSIELVDGNRSREPLTNIFGTLSLGELGVDGFFIVSGYLIAQSVATSSSLVSYLWKRVLRIYPAFIAAFLVVFFVVGPISGGDLGSLNKFGWFEQATNMLLLGEPKLPGAFAGLHYPTLNGSMWTISYEFGCYLTVAALSVLGAFHSKRNFVMSLIAVSALLVLCKLANRAPAISQDLPKMPFATYRLLPLFLSGSAFYVFHRLIPFRKELAIVAALMLILMLFGQKTQIIAIPTFGAYLIFWLAFLGNTPRLNSINSGVDVSYGIYLYAWPVQSLLIKFVSGISPIEVMVVTTIVSAALAMLSWRLIEKPSLSLKHLGEKLPTVSGHRFDPGGPGLVKASAHDANITS